MRWMTRGRFIYTSNEQPLAATYGASQAQAVVTAHNALHDVIDKVSELTADSHRIEQTLSSLIKGKYITPANIGGNSFQYLETALADAEAKKHDIVNLLRMAGMC